MKQLTIAIDGFSSCGKSTLAKALARKLNFIFIDSGAMYRAVTLYALRNDFILGRHIDEAKIIASLPYIDIRFELDSHTARPEVILNDENVEKAIRSMEVSSYVSPVAAIPEVRYKLVNLQREMGKFGGVVMDGRDIGSVVFPDAELKLFLTADPEVRVQRRYRELLSKGEQTTPEQVRKNLQERDLKDSTRAESPLIRTADAIEVDNSHLDQDEQLELILKLIGEKFNINR